jgi:hypothetical protein
MSACNQTRCSNEIPGVHISADGDGLDLVKGVLESRDRTFCPHAYRTDEFWAYRHKITVSSSELADVIGCGYKSRKKLFDMKQSPRHTDIPDNPHMKYGREMESVALERVRPLFEWMGFEMLLDPPMCHTNFMVGSTPDAILYIRDGDIHQWVPVEVKCSMYNEYPTPRPNHLIQMHVHMHVWNTRRCFFVGFHERRTFVREISWDQVLWDMLAGAILDFHECLVIGMIPKRNTQKEANETFIEVNCIKKLEEQCCYRECYPGVHHGI